MIRHHADFRIDPMNPPLWERWAALPQPVEALRFDPRIPSWEPMLRGLPSQGVFCVTVLYRTPGVDADAFLDRSRAMMLALAVALGALAAWWAWRLGGAPAAISVAACFAFDPSLLAHAPLVKNDVAFGLTFFALAFAIWRLGERVTWGRLLIAGAACGAGLSVKFSGVLLPLVAALLLALRGSLPGTWRVLGLEARGRGGRLMAAAGTLVAVIALGWMIVWASYGWRGSPSSDPGSRLPTERILQTAAISDVAAHDPGAVLRAIARVESLSVLPQPWTYGLAFTYASLQAHGSYLRGEFSETGWWSYFPLTMLYKTPIATLLALVLAAAALAPLARLRSWTAWCVAAPAAAYALSCILSKMDLGVRHLLPLFPFLFLAIGVAAARAWRVRPGAAAAVAALLAAGLVFESAAAYPDYIPFFNAVAGGARGGVRLLGDSNLDWGQDLAGLARWRRAHPDRPLYLSYFGAADPAYYGLRYVPLPGGYFLDADARLPDEPAYVAISATNLQGIYHPESLREIFAPLRRREPIAVIGGSIYVFDFDPARDRWGGGPGPGP